MRENFLTGHCSLIKVCVPDTIKLIWFLTLWVGKVFLSPLWNRCSCDNSNTPLFTTSVVIITHQAHWFSGLIRTIAVDCISLRLWVFLCVALLQALKQFLMWDFLSFSPIKKSNGTFEVTYEVLFETFWGEKNLEKGKGREFNHHHWGVTKWKSVLNQNDKWIWIRYFLHLVHWGGYWMARDVWVQLPPKILSTRSCFTQI